MKPDQPIPRWVIRVTYPDGQEAYLRHGAEVGAGPIVKFPSKKLALINLEFMSQGLDDDCAIAAVRWTGREEENTP